MQVTPTPKRKQRLSATAVILACLAVSTVVVAQIMRPNVPTAPTKNLHPTIGTLYMESKLGSFKLMGNNPENPPAGTLDINFKGSVLISGIEGHGTLTPSGNIKREYYDQARNKQVWHGTGKLVVSGTMENAEWFGEDLTGTFIGHGYFRLKGEFAKDKTTGFYWFDPAKKTPWETTMSSVAVPEEKRAPPLALPPGQKPKAVKVGVGL